MMEASSSFPTSTLSVSPTPVIVESPYAGKSKWWPVAMWQRWRNRVYCRRCCLDSVTRGEAPFASHLFYTQFLDDSDPIERKWGIENGLAWGCLAERTVVYVDRGISRGMEQGIRHANECGRPVDYRHLKEWLDYKHV
jgi:hypothetical protein